MDSLTQIVLGAAVGEVVLGRKIGNRAQLAGAIAGTIPDLDILATMYYDDTLSEIVIHRSYSHALFCHLLAAFPFAWISWLLNKKKAPYMGWYWLWFFALTTHALLDACTTYGTQLFLPFSNYLVGFNNISVIDPLYTLPFMAFLIGCLFLGRDDPKRIKWAWRGIVISSSYMLLTFGVKWHINNTFRNALKEQSIAYERMSTSPTFFNNALWAGMAYNDSTLIVGEYSVLQKDKWIDFVQYKRNLHLENEFRSRELDALKWFSQGLYFLEKRDSQTLRVYIVKWGRANYEKTRPEEAFIFYHEIKKTKAGFTLDAIRPKFTKEDFNKAFGQLWRRIWEK